MADSKEDQVETTDGNSLMLTTSSPEDYKLYQTIGMGYGGAVDIKLYYHVVSQQPVVVREYNLEFLNEEQLIEVQKEMMLSGTLSHPNVACYLNNFVWRQHLWVVQPLMHYGSCADVMHSADKFKNGFPEKMISIILRDVIEGLKYLHSLGIVHRSVRAKHFLIHSSGVVKLSGLRTMVQMLESGERMRTLHHHSPAVVENICWLAPEVLAQDLEGYTTKSDIYSIGIAALELSTGEAPFAGLPVTEIFMHKLRGHPPLLLKRQPEENVFSRLFTDVVDKCVNYNSAERPTTKQLLHTSFFKLRRGANGESLLPDMLLPVMPLNHTKLSLARIDPMKQIEGRMNQFHINSEWSFSTS